jgi:uncharacterized integral membrane protein
MMRFLSWFVTIALLLIALGFALANNEAVTLSLWPFDAALTMPLSVLALGLLFIGFLLGSLIMWIALLPTRFQACRLRRELAALEEKQQAMPAPPSPPQKKRCWFGARKCH